MPVKPLLCLRNENVYQAFARARRDGLFPANAKLFSGSHGVPQPEAPAGYETVGSVLIRPREAFAVGLPRRVRDRRLRADPPPRGVRRRRARPGLRPGRRMRRRGLARSPQAAAAPLPMLL